MAECPELGFRISAGSLSLDQLSADAIGHVTLRLYQQIHQKIVQAIASELPLPAPLSSLSRPERWLAQNAGNAGAPDSLRSREAARALGVSASTVKRMVRDGALEARRTPGGHLRVPVKAIADYMNRSKTEFSSLIVA